MTPVCPFCHNPAELVDSAVIYNGRSYGMAWLCRPCWAYVGCHREAPGDKPLGTLADAETRNARMSVHALLDPLWRGVEPYDGAGKPRKRVYAWLAHHMGLVKDTCRVGMFDTDQCRNAVEILVDATWTTVLDWEKSGGAG